MGLPGPGSELRMKGLPLSEGCAVARVCLFSEQRHSNLPRYDIAANGSGDEIARLQKALGVVAERLEAIRAQVETKVGKPEAEIFVAQKMLVEDKNLYDDIVGWIREKRVNVETAVAQTLDEYEAQLAAVDDEYLRERASDFGEVKRRILDVLAGMRPALECESEEHCQRGRNRIVVAEDLTPSLTVDLDADHLLGFATEHGGINSHAAILARALGIPAVSGLQGIRQRVGCSTEILVNGDTGEVVIWPSEKTIASAHAAGPGSMRLPAPVRPVNGFEVMANVANDADVRQAVHMGAEGIGLYRTEIEVIAAPQLLNEDMLAERYSGVLEAMHGRKVVFRLFDIGSDKPLPSVEANTERNPALGRRGARLLLARPDLLTIQARALARASRHGPIHVMYPMIAGVDQFLRLKRLFTEAIAGSAAGTIAHGVMIEVPSACLEASDLFSHVDFASVGTNDLTQYFFAVDRNNELVAEDYNADQPVFWRLLASLANAAAERGKPLSICGELAGDASFIPRLLEVGIRRVSVSPRRISNLRHAAQRHLKAKNRAPNDAESGCEEQEANTI